MGFDPNEWEVVGPTQPQQQPQFNPSDWEVVPQQPQLTGPVDDTFWGRLKNNTVAAANAAFPFADEGAAALRSVIPGYGSYDQELAAIRSGEKDYATLHPYSAGASSLAGVLSTAPLLPSGVAARTGLAAKAGQAALEGGAYGAYQGFGSGEGGLANRANAAEDSALMGALLSPAIVGGLGAASKGLGALAERVRPPTAAEEMIQSLKITPADVQKAGRFKTIEEAKTAMQDMLDGAKARGVFTGDADINAIAGRNSDAIDALSQQVGNMVKAADTQGTPALSFKNARQFIDQNPFEEAKLLDQFQRRMQTINDKWDGTVSGLNQLKRQIGKSAFNSEADSKAFDRVIYSDLRETVERGADQLGAGMGNEVRALNKQLGQHYNLEDILSKGMRREVASELRAPKKFGLTSLPVLGSGAGATYLLGHPGIAAAMLASFGAKTVLNSKVGASALSGAIGLGSKAASGASTLGDPRIIRLAEALVGGAQSGQDQTSSLPTGRGTPTAGASAQISSQPQQRQQGSQGNTTPLGNSYSTSPISYNATPEESPGQAGGSYQDIARALVPAVVQVESNGNSRAVSRAGAMGLMQLMPAMAKAYGVSDPFDPRQNVEGGTKLLADELQRFRDPALALAAFNAGSPRVLKALKRASDLNGDGRISFDEASPYLPKETRAYVAKLARIISA